MLPPVSTARYSPALRFGEYKSWDQVKKEITQSIQTPSLEVWYQENREDLTAFLNQRLFPNYSRKDLLKDLYALLNEAHTRPDKSTSYARLKDLKSRVQQKTGDSGGFDWDRVMYAYRQMADRELISLGDTGLFGIGWNPMNWTRGYLASDQGRYVLKQLG